MLSGPGVQLDAGGHRLDLRAVEVLEHVLRGEREADRDDHQLGEAETALAQRAPDQAVLQVARRGADHDRGQRREDERQAEDGAEAVRHEPAERHLLRVREVRQPGGAVDQREPDRGERQQQAEQQPLRGQLTRGADERGRDVAGGRLRPLERSARAGRTRRGARRRRPAPCARVTVALTPFGSVEVFSVSVYRPFWLTLNAKWPSALVTVLAVSLPASLIEMVTPLTPLPLPSFRVPATQPSAGSTVHCGTAVMVALCTTVFVGVGVGLGVAAIAGATAARETPAAASRAIPRSLMRCARRRGAIGSRTGVPPVRRLGTRCRVRQACSCRTPQRFVQVSLSP